MNEFSLSMPEYLQRDGQQVPMQTHMRGRFRKPMPWNIQPEYGGGPNPGGEETGGQLQDLLRQVPSAKPWNIPTDDLIGFGAGQPGAEPGWTGDMSPPNPDSEGAFVNEQKQFRPPVPAMIGPYPWNQKPTGTPVGTSNAQPGWNAIAQPKPTGTPMGPATFAPATQMGPRQSGEPVRPRPNLRFAGPGGVQRFASGGRVEMPDYLKGIGLGKVGPAGDSGSSAGAAFSAPPSKMAPLSGVAPGGGGLNIQAVTPMFTPPATVVDPKNPGAPVEAPQELILPKLGRSRRSLTPSIRGYTPGGNTFGVAKLRTTRNIMPRFAEGGRVPSLSSYVQTAIAEGVDEAPMFNMFHHDGPDMNDPQGVTDMDSEGLEPGGKVRGYAKGGRVPAAKGKTLREIAAEKKLEVDFDRLNHSGNDDQVEYRKQFFDQLEQMGINPYGTRGAGALEFGEDSWNVNSMDESGYRTVTNPWARFNGRDLSRQDQYALMDRLGMSDDPELRGLFARGRGADLYQGDRGMYNEYLADLGNMVYDDELGWLPGEGGFQEGSRVGRSFKNMQKWGPAAVLAAGAISNVMQTGSMFGGPTGGEGVGGGGAGGGFGGEAASEAATGAFDTGGWTGTGIDGATGVSPGGFGSGAAGDLAGTFDGAGWEGTGINGNTGVSPGGFGSNGLGLDPYEIDMAPGSVSTNNPGALEQASNWARQNLGLDPDKAIQWARSNPMQVARIVAAIAGGVAGGGNGDNANYPDYAPGPTGPAGPGPMGPAEVKPWEESAGGAQSGLSMSGGGNFSVNVPANGYYQQAYRPLEDEVLKQAKDRLDSSFRESKALEAVGDVASAFNAQRGALGRDASRRGLRAPTSRDMIGMAASEGAARALAANKARRDMEESAIAQGAGLVSQGQRYIDRDVQLAAAATNAGGSMAAAQANAQFNRENAAANRAFQANQQARADANRRYEFDTNSGLERERINRGIYTSDRADSRQQDADNDARRQRNIAGLGTIISGIGSIFGKGYESGGRVIDGHAEQVPDADDGGRVQGPGHGTSDSIPARLSKGEMVLNTDAVALIDKKSPGLIDRVNQLGLIQRAMKNGVVGDIRPFLNSNVRRQHTKTIGIRG